MNEETIHITTRNIWLSNLSKVEEKGTYKTIHQWKKENGLETHNYYSPLDSSKTPFYSFKIRNDSMFCSGVYCEKIESFYLQDNILISVFDYNNKKMSDEESTIFWSKKYAIIGFYNHIWGGIDLFQYPRHPNLHEKLYQKIIHHHKNQYSQK